MIIKTFTAENRLQALLKIREELGPDALIISERKVKKGGIIGAWSKEYIELVAAKKEMAVESKSFDNTRKALIEEEIPEVIARLRQERTAVTPSEQAEFEFTEPSVTQQRNSRVRAAGAIELSGTLPKTVALIGPTGVGKTTTIAKLAAQYALNERKRVGLLTLDTFRIAAVEQLRTYAQIMDVPMEVASNASEIQEAMTSFIKTELLLIDTVGRSHKSDRHLTDLTRALAPLASENHLVISATTKSQDVKQIIQQFSQVGFNRIIITKLDETDSPESVLHECSQYNIPISYLTNGQRVPEDLQIASEAALDRLYKMPV